MQLTVHGVLLASVFDLRYLAIKCGLQPWPLHKLSIEHLKVKLSEDFRLEQVRWKGKHSRDSDVKYAAKSVRVPIELFKFFEEKLNGSSEDNSLQKFIADHCKEYLNKSFRTGNSAKNEAEVNVDGTQSEVLLTKPKICLINSEMKCEEALWQIREYDYPSNLLLRLKAWLNSNYSNSVFSRHCNEYKVLGFGCRLNASRSTATLLQLVTHHGFCALIQLSKLKKIPDELKVCCS